MTNAASPAELEESLRAIGAARYHHRHPFNLRMHAGELSREEIQLWVANRYYYQTRIPIKDGLILGKAADAAFRREWIERIHDHDGRRAGEGGLELWLRLGDAVGLARPSLDNLEQVLPGVRRACDAYVEFVGGHELLESVAASLTELFAGDIMHVRIAAFEKHYSWVDSEGLAYFRSRTQKAPRDAEFGLAFVLEHARTTADQERCLGALTRKCEILWGLLDAIERAGSCPRISPHALLRESDGHRVAVLPERAVRLSGSGPEILELCDGSRSGLQVASAMSDRHPSANAAGVTDEVHDFLEAMGQQGVLVFEPSAHHEM